MTKLVVGVNDLATTHPELLKRWDYSKNLINPTEITAGSNKDAYWLCEKGHSYFSQIRRRAKGAGCPYCANKKVLVGFNDLATTNPELLEEWDYEKNVLKPTEVTAGSEKKAWWKCKTCNHNWEAMIFTRAKGLHSGCPKCGKVSMGKKFSAPKTYQNSFEYNHPDLLKEWDYDKNNIKPSEIRRCCAKKVWWKCDKGHSYLASVELKAKVGYGKGCTVCSGRRVLSGLNDLATIHPELAEEWDFEKNILKPTEVTKGNNKKVWWKCKVCGYNWKAAICSRVRGTGCPECGNAKKGKKIAIKNSISRTYNNSLEYNYPDLLKEWDYNKNKADPSKVNKGSGKRFWWKCSKGHSYLTSVNVKVKAGCGKGCPICSGRQALIGFNDLTTTCPDLVKDWCYEKNIIKPTEITKGSGRKVWWKCHKCGYVWKASVSNRSQGRGCSICSGSPLERLTYEILTELNLNLKKEWAQNIDNCRRRFDYYLPNKNLCVEVDGGQHFFDSGWSISFEDVIKGDNQKNEYLFSKDIPLLRIPDLKFFDIPLTFNGNTIQSIYATDDQLKDILKETITEFIKTRKIPQWILDIYKDSSDTNYYDVATKMNEW